MWRKHLPVVLGSNWCIKVLGGVKKERRSEPGSLRRPDMYSRYRTFAGTYPPAYTGTTEVYGDDVI